jgi:twitching motility protein PilT
VATLFKSETKDLVERLLARRYDGPEERRLLIEELAASTSIKTIELVKCLFTPDAEVRKAAAQSLATRRDPETLRHAIAALSGRPEAARRAALTAIASLPGVDLAAEIGKLIDAQDANLRRSAAEAVLDMPLTAQTAPLLARIVETGEAAHRLKAVQRFAEVAQPQHVPFFERLLDDPDERIRFAAFQAMAKHAGPQHLDLFLRRVPDEPYATQQFLVQAIQQLVPRSGPQAIDQVLGLLASGNTGLRQAALKILMALPDRVAVVRRFIAYSKQLAGWVRDRALESMREFGQDVLEPALELTQDNDPDVRSAALTLVSSFHDPRVAPAAARLLGDPDWWLVINATEVLGRLKEQRAVPGLVQALARDEVRWAVVEALGRIGGPQALQALAQLVKDPRPEIRIEALGALALSEDPAVLPILQQAAEHDPVKWVRARAFDMLKDLARKKSATLDEAAVRAAVAATTVAAGAPEIHALLALARRQGASDLHVSVDSVPALRVAGQLVRLQGEPLSAERAERLLGGLLSPAQRERLDKEKQLDACFHVENDGRYRANIFIDRKGMNGAFRVIPEQPPTIADLGLPPDVAEITMIHQGIIIVTGAAGCGKSTTLAALVNLVNETRRDHVLTLEDPVEFVHPFKSCVINQREIGKHSQSFARALRAALREDPDVIVLGEMRDSETVSLALTAAETGHVVLATLNATTAPKAIDRIISSFPVEEQCQVRESFADSLKIIIAQQLLPAAGGKGRLACFEILKGTRAIQNLIRDNKTFQIPSMMQMGQASGMRTFEDSLMDLVRRGAITPETAWMRATSKDAFEPLVSPKFLEELLA